MDRNYVPLVKRLTRCPFTAEARVRFPYGIQHSGVEEMVSLAGLITQRPPVRVWPPLLKLTEELKKNIGNKEGENRYECFTGVNGIITQACIGYNQ